MKTKNTPAFPVEISLDENGNIRGAKTSSLSGFEIGLTKREYFAGLAMQGLLSNPNGGMSKGGSATFSPDGISELAVNHADALFEKLSVDEITVLETLRIEIPKGFMNAGISTCNHFIADTNDSSNWDTIKLPLPKGKWSIQSIEGKMVTLICCDNKNINLATNH